MKKYRIPALEKAIAILELIATSEKEYTITEIHKKLNISKSTVFTTLTVLESYDFVKKNDKGYYDIGFKLYQLGMKYVSNIDLIKIARPYLKRLMEETGFTVHLGILDEGEVLFVDKVEPNTFIKFSTFPGMRSALHISSLGKAICAFLDEAELDKLISSKGLGKYTPKTITNIDQFKNELKHIRENGYAVEDEEGELGVRCIGAPLFSKDSRPVAAISVTSVTSELTDELYTQVGNTVVTIANEISRELGCIKNIEGGFQ